VVFLFLFMVRRKIIFFCLSEKQKIQIRKKEQKIMQPIVSLNSGLNLKSNRFLQSNSLTPNEFAATNVFPTTVSVNQLCVKLSQKQPEGKHGWKFTLRVNGTDTALEVKVSNGEQEDSVRHHLTISAMSALSVRCDSIGHPIPCLASVTYC
jgi:hypothetical protein